LRFDAQHFELLTDLLLDELPENPAREMKETFGCGGGAPSIGGLKQPSRTTRCNCTVGHVDKLMRRSFSGKTSEVIKLFCYFSGFVKVAVMVLIYRAALEAIGFLMLSVLNHLADLWVRFAGWKNSQ